MSPRKNERTGNDRPAPSDQEEWEAPVRGRPRHVDTVFSVRVDRQLAQRIREAARRAGVPTSTWIRNTLGRALSERNSPTSPEVDVSDQGATAMNYEGIQGSFSTASTGRRQEPVAA